MHKNYTATYLYIIKVVMLSAAVIAAFLVFNFFFMVANGILPNWFPWIANMIFIVFGVVFLFLQLTAKKPSFTFTDDSFKYKRKNIKYSTIERLIPAQGGSEPEVVFKDKSTYVLELSWFLKKDRIAIRQTIESNINNEQ